MTESNAIRDRLIAMGVCGDSPRWSSFALDELFKNATKSDRSGVGQVFHECFALLADTRLSEEVASFVKDLAVCAFTKHHDSYEGSDLTRMGDSVCMGCSPAQAYLGMYTLPSDALTPAVVVRILKTLQGTSLWDEAVANLEDGSQDASVQRELREWLAEGIPEPFRADIRRLAGT